MRAGFYVSTVMRRKSVGCWRSGNEETPFREPRPQNVENQHLSVPLHICSLRLMHDEQTTAQPPSKRSSHFQFWHSAVLPFASILGIEFSIDYLRIKDGKSIKEE
jgi:hypothetical protein